MQTSLFNTIKNNYHNMHTEPYIYNTLAKLALRSIQLDYELLRTTVPMRKSEFLWKKFLFMLFAPMFWHEESQAYRIRIWGKNIYFEGRSDIGILQSQFIHNTYLSLLPIQNETIIDIGAHVGEFAIFCNHTLHPRRMISFEPVEQSYRILQKNKGVDTYRYAIGGSSHTTMHIPENTALSSSFPAFKNEKQEIAPCVRLDDLPEIQNLHAIGLLKIDVEGMEYDVLSASKETLKKTRYLLIELGIARAQTKPPLDTLVYIKTILPNASLIHVGQKFGSEFRTDSIDLLFQIADRE